MPRLLSPVVPLVLALVAPAVGIIACVSSSGSGGVVAFDAGVAAFDGGGNADGAALPPADAAPPDGGTLDAADDADAADDGASPAFTTFQVALTTVAACAVFPDGRMKCWGRPLVGESANIGDAPGQMGAALSYVTLPKRVKTIRANETGPFCIIFEDGGLRCWGGGAVGQPTPGGLGLDKITTNIDLGAGRTAIDVAPGPSTCAVLDDHTVTCWGSNAQGELGQGDTVDRVTPSPAVALGTGRTAKSIVAGLAFHCAVLDDDRLKCWGRNNNTVGDVGIGGALCIGGTAHIGNDPNEMGDNLAYAKLGTNPGTGLPWKVKKVVAGDTRACAILDNDRVKCWGRNDGGGTLGSGGAQAYGDSLVDDAIAFVDVGTNPATSQPWAVTDLVAGDIAACVLLPDTTVRCWGEDSGFGALGRGVNGIVGNAAGQMGDALVPVAFKTGRTPSAIYAGTYSTCARVDTATLNCWGANNAGLLGQGVSNPSSGGSPADLGASFRETLLQ